MSDEQGQDALLDIALSVAEGGQVAWDSARARVPTSALPFVEALEAVSMLAASRRAQSATPAPPLTRWGHLHILGAAPGGAPNQYAARDETLGREVVLTLIGPMDGDVVRTERLLAVARRRVSVVHPCLATVFGADYAQDRVGFWAEPVAGRSLADAVAQGAKYGVVEACELLLDASRAVAALHDVGLAIGGLTAGDIVVTPARQTIVRATLCSEDPVLGADPERCSPQEDTFALGALLILLLGGIDAGESPDPAALISRLRSVRPDVRPALGTAIERALSPDRGQRFAHARLLAAALEDGLADAPVTAEWVVGFSVTLLLMAALIWYALLVH